MKRILILFLTASLTTQIGCSQNSERIEKIRLDAFFDTLERNNKFMGNVAVAHGKELIYTKSVGFIDIEHGMKANENSKYRIGSISKTFTTVLIFKAIEENRLNLNQAIDIFFPKIENANKITIKHLLLHRSGICNFTDNESYLSWNTQSKTEQEMIEIISNAGSDFEPDKKASYSNSNFVLLTYILEKIYNDPYSKLLEEKIIEPIGLKNTYYGKKINVKDNECNSYKYMEIWKFNSGTNSSVSSGEGRWKIEPETDMSIPLGAMGIVSMPVDLTIFSEALFNEKLVSINSLNEMKTIKDGFGMGLIQMPFCGRTGFGHSGNIDGFVSLFVYFPDSNISIAYTSNGMNHNENDIITILLNVVYGEPFKVPEL